jgi:hypothetical protein
MRDRVVTCLLAALGAIMLVSGCGTVAPSPATTAASRTSPAVAATATPAPHSVLPSPIVTDPGGVAAAIGQVVVPGGARLLPAYVPAGMSAIVRAYPQYYTVTYSDDPHEREFTLEVNAGANPPPAIGPNHSQSFLDFRGVRTLYTVFDTTAPTSQRYLEWPDEKGIATGPPGPDYLLSASGLTEDEFFRIANSLQAL